MNMTSPVETEHVDRPGGAPLGPGSLTWKYAGDRRSLLLVGRAGTLQNMHPAVGQALQDHSDFFDNPYDRLFRSIPPILGVVFDPDPERTAVEVRGFHDQIKGVRADGRRYHALDPDVFWWTHVTFVESVIATAALFDRPLTEGEKDQVVREGVTWWRRYGMSERPVLDDYASFRAYWERMFAEELEGNATTAWAFEADARRLPRPAGVPRPLWWLVRVPVHRASLWLTTATLPPEACEILGQRPSRAGRVAFATFARVQRKVWPLLPERVRVLRRARAGMRSAGV